MKHLRACDGQMLTGETVSHSLTETELGKRTKCSDFITATWKHGGILVLISSKFKTGPDQKTFLKRSNIKSV